LLRRLHEKKLIVQSSDGTLLAGEVGERLVNHYSFYSAFATPEEYRLVHYGRIELARTRMLREGDGTLLFLWDGDYAAATLAMLLRTEGGFESDGDGFALEITRSSVSSVGTALRALATRPDWPTALELARAVPIKAAEKNDPFLDSELLAADYAARVVDMEGARRLVAALT
ncbi:hypothetical protein EON79_03520, partial [bacterium]